MTSQPGLQAIALHILTNISQLKGSQRMKYYQEKHFLKNYAEDEA